MRTTAERFATATGEWEAVFQSLPTPDEGWATARAVADVVHLSPSTVTRRLQALQEGGRVESSTDKAVTGARGRVWRQRADQPRVMGPIETVELPAEDVQPDPDPVQRYVDAADPAGRACEKCGGPIDPVEAEAGYTRCEDCDPDGDHSVHGPAPELSADETAAEEPDPKAEARPVVLVASPVAGQPPQRAEVWEDNPNLSVVKVVYCDSRASARVARKRILGPADDSQAGQPSAGIGTPGAIAADAGLSADYSQPLTDFEQRAGVIHPTAPLVDEYDGDPSPVSPAPTGGDYAAITEALAPAADPLTAADARALTDQIRVQVADLLPLIKEAYNRRAHVALGYTSWAEYCDTELRGLRMPLAERQAATVELAAAHMSTRAIAGAIGSSEATVRRDLAAAAAAGATVDGPERVTGLDGRSYPARKPPAPKLDPAAVVAASQPADPDPLRIRAHAWQVMHPQARVWIATSRLGIDYHRPADDDRTLSGALLTGCRRSMRTGERLSIADVENELSAKPCPRCWPEPTEPPAAATAGSEDGPAGPAVSAHDPRAETMSGDSRPQDRPGATPATVDVWHCQACANSWPIEAGQPNECPTCGGRGGFTAPPQTVEPGSDYEQDPAARIAAVAEVAPEYVQPAGEALEGEVIPAPAPGGLPDQAYRIAVADGIRALGKAIDALQELTWDAGVGGTLTLPDLKHERRRPNNLISHLQKAA